MGTNYYFHRNTCEHCKRSDEPVHIGKSSGGWTFSFQGFRSEDDPLGVIKSEADWRRVIAESDGEIFDEYGARVGVTEFWRMVEAKRTAPNNQTTYCRNDPHHSRYGYKVCGYDDETGSSFTFGEFS